MKAEKKTISATGWFGATIINNHHQQPSFTPSTIINKSHQHH